MVKEINNFVENLLSQIEPRQKKILEKRFGIENGEKQTLQAVGALFGITRERVRQIEDQSLKKIKSLLTTEKTIFADWTTFVKNYLQAAGAIRRDDLFIQDLKYLALSPGEKWLNFFDWKMKFLFTLNNEPKFSEPDENLHGFWYLNEDARKKALETIKKYQIFFQKAGQQKIVIQKEHLNHIQDLSEIGYLALSKNFGLNIFGDFGLNSWPEIHPRIVGDKAYLVLKKNEEPLHFKELANKINSLRFDAKKAHPQTVHNELIGDNRFVLVGRGIYGLAEQGYLPGTARDVLTRILRQHGPLNFSRIIQLVKKERFLRENTLALNLQNKRYFQKLPDKRFALINES